MPTRIFRSETGFQSFEAFGSAALRSNPWIIFSWPRTVCASAKEAEPSPSAARKERRERLFNDRCGSKALTPNEDSFSVEFMFAVCRKQKGKVTSEVLPISKWRLKG